MKKFLKDIGRYFVLFIIVSFTLNKLVFHKYAPSGNTFYEQKKDYFLKHKENFNTIFFGSSRIYRQLDPEIVDSLLADFNISSFNLAAPATFNPETYKLYEDLLNEHELDLDFVFMELHPLSVIALKNITSSKNYYFADLDNLNYSFSYISNTQAGMMEKTYHYTTYGLTYLIKQVALPKFDFAETSNYGFPEGYNGFYSLSTELSKNDIYRFKRRTEQFQKDTTVLNERIKSSLKWYEKSRKHHHINEAHVERLNKIIKLSEEKGIELYFLIPPRHDDYSEIIDIKYALEPGRVIELANYNEFPQLYQADYSFDVGHLNEKGSKLFSVLFAKAFAERSFNTTNREISAK